MLLNRSPYLRKLHGTLITANWLALKLWLKNRNRARMFPGVIYRSYLGLGGEGPWRCMSVFDAFPELKEGRITLQHTRGSGLHAPLEELGDLALITRAVDPDVIFEIGTFRGRTALNFALNSRTDCRIYTLDLPPEHRETFSRITNFGDTILIAHSETGIDYRGSDVAHKIEQLLGNSLDFDFSPYYGKADLVFVDGAHHYEAARSDTENALRMVRPGGVVLWHDFANFGDYGDVTRAVVDCVGASRIIQIENTQIAMYRATDEKI